MATAPLSNVQEVLDGISALAAEPRQKSTPPPVEAPAPLAETNAALLREIMGGGDLGPYISNTMREAYVRTLLGGAPFEHTFFVLDGRVAITFKEPSMAQAALHGRLSGQLNSGDVEGMNALTLLYFLHRVDFPKDSARAGVVLAPPTAADLGTGLSPEQLSLQLQDMLVERLDQLGGSLLRLLSSLWIMFSGAWRYLIQESLPRTF